MSNRFGRFSGSGEGLYHEFRMQRSSWWKVLNRTYHSERNYRLQTKPIRTNKFNLVPIIPFKEHTRFTSKRASSQSLKKLRYCDNLRKSELELKERDRGVET